MNETSCEIAKLTLSTPKKKKKWVLFEDKDHLQREEVGGENGDLVNHGSLGRDRVRKQVLPKFEGVDGEGRLENPCELDLKMHRPQHPSVCWDEGIDDQSSSAEEKIFFLLASPIRGFKY